MTDKKNKTEPSKVVTIPITWNTPDDMISRFATNMVVQTMDDVLKISFYEMKPEIRLDPSLPPPTEMKADCVANVIMSRAKLEDIVKAFQGQIDALKKLEE